jgi:hypothetical protein
MTTVRTMKIAVVSGMAGLALLIGGFVLTGSFASAQTPEPSQTPQTQPAPSDPGTTPRGDKECDEGTDGAGTTGVRFGGGGSFRQ